MHLGPELCYVFGFRLLLHLKFIKLASNSWRCTCILNNLPIHFPSSSKSIIYIGLHDFHLHLSLLRHDSAAIIYRADFNHRSHYFHVPLSSFAAGFSMLSWSRIRSSSAFPATTSCVCSFANMFSPKTLIQLVCSSYICLHINIIYTVTPESISCILTHTASEYILHLFYVYTYIIYC